MPYADLRPYTGRLNALFSPQGWTREYTVETMANITRVRKDECIASVRCWSPARSRSLGLGSDSGTGEEQADDDNTMASADAQAFRRACSCRGLDFTQPQWDSEKPVPWRSFRATLKTLFVDFPAGLSSTAYQADFCVGFMGATRTIRAGKLDLRR